MYSFFYIFALIMKSRKLIVLRHGKAESLSLEIDDFMRPLNSEGKAKINSVADFLETESLFPQMIVSSAALRAAQTSQIVIDKLDVDSDKVFYDKNLYFNGEDAYFNAVFGLPENVDIAMLVGHNPLIENFVNYFSKSGIYFSAGDFVVIEFFAEQWTEIANCSCKILFSSKK